MSDQQYPVYQPPPVNPGTYPSHSPIPYASPSPYASPNPYADHYPYAYPPVQDQTTNGFAIASLVCSIVGIQILGWIFGGVALSQISRTGQKGRGLAIAGIVIGIAWALIGLMMFASN